MSKVEKLDDYYLVKDVATDQYFMLDERWEFNGDFEKPTFNPSIRSNYGKLGCVNDIISHAFIRDGQIQYLTDCTHDMAGKTVDCIDFVYGED